MSDTAREAVARAIEAELFRVQELDTKRGIITPERIADSAISAFTAWLQENGWVIVPMEPTPRMCDEAESSDYRSDRSFITRGEAMAETYRSMLAAAPKPETGR